MYGSEDSLELKRSIDLYRKNNMKIKDSALQEIKSGEIPKRYSRIFLQETKYLPRDWQPNGSDYYIDHHFSDQIAAITWEKGDVKKRYVIWEREDYKMFDEERNRKILNELDVVE